MKTLPKSDERKKYTLGIHIHRLKLIFNKSDSLKKYCPATIGFKSSLSPTSNWNILISPCDVCRDFVGAKNYSCPCQYFGESGAREKTLEAIKEYEKNK